MKFQITYQGIFDVPRAYDELWMTFPEAGEPTGRGKDRLVFHIGQDVTVMITRNGIVQVTWSNEEEKIRGLEILENVLPPLKGRKKAVLKPLNQTPFKIPYPSPPDLKLIWCKEGVQYLSFDKYRLIKHERDEMMKDYISRLDFDSLQRRAEMLYPNLPEEWQKKLAPLFKDKLFMRMKIAWAKVFLWEFNRLLWKKSRTQSLER